MKTKPSPSLYRYWNSRRSTTSVSIFAPALKVRSTVLPVTTFLTLVRTKAPPLPGFTCWNSITVHSWPSMLRTTPFLMSAVEAMRDEIRSVGKWRRKQRRQTSLRCSGCRAQNVVQREHVGAESETGDDPRRDRRNHARVAEFLARVRVRNVHLDERDAGLGDEGGSVPQRVRIVGERRRIENDRGLACRRPRTASRSVPPRRWSGAGRFRSPRGADCSSSARRSSSVPEPYTSGSREPSRPRFGPFNTSTATMPKAYRSRSLKADGSRASRLSTLRLRLLIFS